MLLTIKYQNNETTLYVALDLFTIRQLKRIICNYKDINIITHDIMLIYNNKILDNNLTNIHYDITNGSVIDAYISIRTPMEVAMMKMIHESQKY